MEGNNFEGRLSSVEAHYKSLHGEVESINSKLDRIADNMLRSQKPQYSNIIALASVIITIMTLAFVPVYTTLARERDDIKSNEISLNRETKELNNKIEQKYESFIDHIKDGHPEVQIEAIKQNDTDIRQNKDAIQTLRDDLKDLRAESIEDRGRFDERIKYLEK